MKSTVKASIWIWKARFLARKCSIFRAKSEFVYLLKTAQQSKNESGCATPKENFLGFLLTVLSIWDTGLDFSFSNFLQTYLRLGKSLLWYGKDWSSVRCQWKTFILFISIRSRFAIKTSFERKCLAESNMTPRWLNLGKSITWVELMTYWEQIQFTTFHTVWKSPKILICIFNGWFWRKNSNKKV